MSVRAFLIALGFRSLHDDAMRGEQAFRRDGYAVTREEFEIGINSMSVPVYSHLGTVIGAISISGPAFRFDPAKEPGLAGGLKEALARIPADGDEDRGPVRGR